MPVLISWIFRWDPWRLSPQQWQRPRLYHSARSDRNRKGRPAPRSGSARVSTPPVSPPARPINFLRVSTLVSGTSPYSTSVILPCSNEAAPALAHGQCPVAVPAAPKQAFRPLWPSAPFRRHAHKPRRYFAGIRRARYRAHARAAVFRPAGCSTFGSTECMRFPKSGGENDDIQLRHVHEQSIKPLP